MPVSTARASRRRYFARRCVACAATALTALAVGTALQTPPAGASTPAPKASTTRLATGVTFSRTNVTLHEGKKAFPEQVLTLNVTLSAHTTLVAAYAGNRVSAGRATLTNLAKQEHAIGGVSGNVFIDKDPHSPGDGGVTHTGTIVKSELSGKDDSLWIDAGGHAHVGDAGFNGTLTTATGHHVIHVSSVNYVDNAAKGAVTVLDYHQAPVALPSCFVATLAPVAKSEYRVQTVALHATRFPGVTGSARALVSCGPHQTPWLTKILTRGVELTGTWGYAVSVRTLISGASHIVHNGKPYHDPSGIPASIDTYQNRRVPVDFACVRSDNRQVLLGSVVGWRSYSAGMTYAELSSYLPKRGCREAIALNALYDSTLVATLPGKSLAMQNPRSSKGEQKLVSGLLVTTR